MHALLFTLKIKPDIKEIYGCAETWYSLKYIDQPIFKMYNLLLFKINKRTWHYLKVKSYKLNEEKKSTIQTLKSSMENKIEFKFNDIPEFFN